MTRLLRVGLLTYALGIGLGFIGASLSAGPLAARSDFVAFYTGATLILERRGPELYDQQVQAAVQLPLLASFGVQPLGGADVNFFLLPPFAAVVLAPFALLPLTASFVAWVLLSAAAIAIATVRTLQRQGWPTTESLIGALLTLTYLPAMAALLLGQNTPVLLLLFALTADNLLSGHPSRAGLWLALTIFKPQYVALPALCLLRTRQWRALGFLGLACLALAAVSLLVVGFQGSLSFVERLWIMSAAGGVQTIHPEVMHNWRGLVTRLLLARGEFLVWPVTLALDLLTVAALAWIWWGPWPTDSESRLVRLSALMLAMLLVSPHANPHDAALLILPACWIATLARRGELPSAAVWLLLGIGHLAGLVAGLVSLEAFANVNVALSSAALIVLLPIGRRAVVRVPALG